MDDSVDLSAGHQERGKEAEKYKKVRVLGEGSMGRAYLVECTDDSRLYVMKRINIGHLGPKQKQNALRQAQLHSLFSHPNIVELKEVYQTTGEKICIVMQYAEGGDLEQFIQLQEGKLLSEQTVLSMFVQICLGLQEIHAKRIVHRDLKTANIFMNADKVLKIGDFGISKSLDKTLMAATTMVGTPYYLSPQMVQGKSYSTKADIWALGVILYQLCSFRLPFQANSLPVLALKILKGSYPPLSNQYSKDIKALIMQMLQIDQKKRPTIEAILLKPFIFKLLSKEDQAKQKQIQENRKQIIKQKEQKEEQKKVKVMDKDKQLKLRARKQKEDKREQMRKQMREDLKKRRAEKDFQSIKTGSNCLTVPDTTALEGKKSPMKSPKKDVAITPKPASLSVNQRGEAVKPWKNKKPGEKKDVTIQMFVPDLKPKPKQEEPNPTGSDFKVQIYVSKKPEAKQAVSSLSQAKPNIRKSLPEVAIDNVQNYHYSQKNIKEEIENLPSDDSQDDYQEDSQSEQNEYDIEQLIDNVRTVEQLTKNLPDPSKSICLYEESQNFDSTLQVKAAPKPEAFENLKAVINSDSLEQLRLILQSKLGEQKFISAYSVVKEHIDNYYQMLNQQQEPNRQTLKEKYVFNKALLREKLQFLTEGEFQRAIQLLFTLILYEDLQMQKNRDAESKYSRMF